jgi:hypothetical protein
MSLACSSIENKNITFKISQYKVMHGTSFGIAVANAIRIKIKYRYL